MHLRAAKHMDIQQVREAMALKVKIKWRETLFKENIARELEGEEPIMIRKQSSSQYASAMCTGCKGMYNSATIHRHRQKCDGIREGRITKSGSRVKFGNIAQLTQ